jgi:hypothetical protein
MFGAPFELCGFNLKVGKFEFVNACAFEYHLRMFYKTRNNNWTTERFLKELDMSSIDEGITLSQLIPSYQTYKIGVHVVDYKYHTTVSYHGYNYEPARTYATLFYLIKNNHLYEIANRHEQKRVSQRQQLNTFKHKVVKVTTRRSSCLISRWKYC